MSAQPETILAAYHQYQDGNLDFAAYLQKAGDSLLAKACALTALVLNEATLFSEFKQLIDTCEGFESIKRCYYTDSGKLYLLVVAILRGQNQAQLDMLARLESSITRKRKRLNHPPPDGPRFIIDTRPRPGDPILNIPGTTKTGQADQCTANTCTDGEPISLITGEELLTLIDIELDGPLPLRFIRTYRSSNPEDIGLGPGWTHSLSERLVIEQAAARASILWHNAEGRILRFAQPEIGARSHNRLEGFSVFRRAEQAYLITPYAQPFGLQRHFYTDETAIGPAAALPLRRLSDAYGNGYDLHYENGLLRELSSSQGDALCFTYDDRAHLLTIQRQGERDAPQCVAEYRYDEEHHLVQARDAESHSEHYAYQNQLLKQRQLKSGYCFHFEWDSEGPAARCVRQWGDLIDGQPTYDYRFRWNPAEREVRVTDTRGGEKCLRFNERGQPVYQRDPEGGETHYEYDDLGQRTRITHPDGLTEQFHYNDPGLLIEHIDRAGHRHRYEYDENGLPVAYIDPEGHSWQRRYTANGQRSADIDPLGRVTRYGYNRLGLLGSLTDPAGHTTRYLWNPRGQLTTLQDAQGRIQHYRYDDHQRLIEIQHSPDQHTRYRYDGNGRVIAITDAQDQTTAYRYTPLGHLEQITDPAGRVTRYEYNGLSQVVKRIQPDGSELHYQYDGERNLIGLSNESGAQYQLRYDLNERLIEEIGFDGRINRYAYNTQGHLISQHVLGAAPPEAPQVKTAKHIREIHFERDPFGRLRRRTTPNGDTQYHYNTRGQLIEARNAHSHLRWAYDAAGQCTEARQGPQRIQYEYDAAGQRSQLHLPNGHLLKYSYNAAGQFTAVRHCNDTRDPGRLLAHIQHDTQGRASRIDHGNGLSTHQTYDPLGRLQHQALVWQTTTVAPAQLLNAVLGRIFETPAPTPELRNLRDYHYDSAGRLSQIDDAQRGRVQYHYDPLDRLTQVQGPIPEHLIHDPAHNVLACADSLEQANQQAQTTQINHNRLTFRGDTHYRYDAYGNRIIAKRGKNGQLETHYHYNDQDQLVEVITANDRVTFAYDPLGRRVEKTSAQGTTRFLWDGDVLLEETLWAPNTAPDPIKPERFRYQAAPAAQSLQQRTYVFQPDSFKPLAYLEGHAIYNYHLDHLGTPDSVSDGKGDIVWAAAYTSYGNLAIQYEDQIEHQPLRFQGQYHDIETGLHYNRHRYYDPNIGSFITQDPIGLAGGLNSYRYVPNPVGLMCKEGSYFSGAVKDYGPGLGLPDSYHDVTEHINWPDRTKLPMIYFIPLVDQAVFCNNTSKINCFDQYLAIARRRLLS